MDRYMIGKDNDGHWYLFKVEEKNIFDACVEYDYGELRPEYEQWLDERRIDGPHRLTFTDPKEE